MLNVIVILVGLTVCPQRISSAFDHRCRPLYPWKVHRCNKRESYGQKFFLILGFKGFKGQVTPEKFIAFKSAYPLKNNDRSSERRTLDLCKQHKPQSQIQL